MVKHEHAGGEYNRRREECDEGVRILSKWYPEIRALRDISVEELESHAADMPPVIYKRCLHVVCEDQRVLDSARYLKQGDLKSFGELMGQSHISMRDLYEISCPEVDTMVEIAQHLPGFSGGRMTGGGFGGCTVNLVKSEDSETFAKQIALRYEKATGMKPDVYVCSAANGAGAE
jgi:galactokinase